MDGVKELFEVKAASSDTIPEGYTGVFNADDFNNIRNNLSGKYILMNDIDLNSYSDWKPIGKNSAQFTGILNGNGYSIDQNIIIAFLTSFVMIFLAAIGVISPILGAFLHNAGAFIVLFNSARVSKADLKKAEKEEEQATEQEDGERDGESSQAPADLTSSASHEPEEAQRQPDETASE